MVPGVTAVIPAYEADATLARLVRTLADELDAVIVVDDGSSAGHRVRDLLPTPPSNVILLTHNANRGKGAALKTAFRHVLDHRPDAAAVVTADADGQHLPADILRVAAEARHHPDALTLGVRALPPTAPLRSRFGNAWARMTFRLFAGRTCADTQTGLRGIPRALLETVWAVPGMRYDYELLMLADVARRGHPFHEVPIEAVYASRGATSHFHTLRDGLGTQAAFVGHCFGRRFRKGGAA